MKTVEYETREKWLEARRKVIGSSDVAGIFGESSWSSPMSVWMEKTGRSGGDTEESERMELARDDEPRIEKWLQRALDRESDGALTLVDPGDFAITYAADIPFAGATLDRIVMRPSIGGTELEPYAVGELKSPGFYMLKRWLDTVPLIYQLQVHWEMMCAGLDLGYLAAVIGGEAFRWAEIEEDAGMRTVLLDGAGRFWRYVETDTPPPSDGHDATKRALDKWMGNGNGETVAIAPALAREWKKVSKLQEEIRERKGRVQEIQNAVKKVIGEASYGQLPDQTFVRANRITVEPQSVDRKGYSYVRLTEAKTS